MPIKLSKFIGTISISLSALLFVVSVQAEYSVKQVKRLSDPVEQSALSETFGAPQDKSMPVLSLSKILEAPNNYLDKSIRVSIPIQQVCQKKGCFFITQVNQQILRVSFKDYGFFIPTDSAGKTVDMLAQLTKKTINEAQAEHFKKDLGNAENAFEAGDVYELVASSVTIPKV